MLPMARSDFRVRECIRLHTGAALAAYVLEFEIPYMMNARLVTENPP